MGIDPNILDLIPKTARTSYDTGERRLMFAVLEDAIGTVQRRCLSKKRGDIRVVEEALSWIRSRDMDWPFTFECICEALDLNASHIRRGILRWREIQKNAPVTVSQHTFRATGRGGGRKRVALRPPTAGEVKSALGS